MRYGDYIIKITLSGTIPLGRQSDMTSYHPFVVDLHISGQAVLHFYYSPVIKDQLPSLNVLGIFHFESILNTKTQASSL